MAQEQTFTSKTASVHSMEMKGQFLVRALSVQRGSKFFPTESKELKRCKFQNICGSVQKNYSGELQNFCTCELRDETESVNKLSFNTRYHLNSIRQFFWKYMKTISA